jgi:signal transduction histidine kinase
VTRRQIRWIAWGGTFLAAILVVSQVVEGPTGSGTSPIGYLTLVGEAVIILSFAVAITKYRLYDIDVVISKTVTYGALAIFITAVYVAIVVGVGTLVGRGDEPNLALAIGATAVVALLFEPIRSRVQRWANRLVYGERATPYAVLSELTTRISEAESNEQALVRLAELLASGTGAEEATVWLRVGDRLRPEATTSDKAPETVQFDGGHLPALIGDAAEPIHHGAELLGALSIRKGTADPVTPSDHRMLQDVAAGAGLLLRNIWLNAELADRAAELRTSRRRLVATQDSERRKLERDLHDGAQQQVVALKVKLGLSKTLAQREGIDQVADVVGDLADDTQRAVDAMRTAARGIYPPLLEAEGLRAALVAAGREASIGVDIEADRIGRYPPEIEATIYFSVLEAISHASKGAPSSARVSLGDDGEVLTFSVRDTYTGPRTGPGLTAVADRLEAVGGTLSVESTPNGGTVVTGRLSARALQRS